MDFKDFKDKYKKKYYIIKAGSNTNIPSELFHFNYLYIDCGTAGPKFNFLKYDASNKIFIENPNTTKRSRKELNEKKTPESLKRWYSQLNDIQRKDIDLENYFFQYKFKDHTEHQLLKKAIKDISNKHDWISCYHQYKQSIINLFQLCPTDILHIIRQLEYPIYSGITGILSEKYQQIFNTKKSLKDKIFIPIINKDIYIEIIFPLKEAHFSKISATYFNKKHNRTFFNELNEYRKYSDPNSLDIDFNNSVIVILSKGTTTLYSDTKQNTIASFNFGKETSVYTKELQYELRRFSYLLKQLYYYNLTINKQQLYILITNSKGKKGICNVCGKKIIDMTDKSIPICSHQLKEDEGRFIFPLLQKELLDTSITSNINAENILIIDDDEFGKLNQRWQTTLYNRWLR